MTLPASMHHPDARLRYVIPALSTVLIVSGCFADPAIIADDDDGSAVEPVGTDTTNETSDEETMASSSDAGCEEPRIEGDETCGPPQECPTECNDGNVCTIDELEGDPSSCTSQCSFRTIEECIPGDGCCPSGCDRGVDDDCREEPCVENCTPRCGDALVDPGEACDDGNTLGVDGCETDCNLTTVDGGWMGSTSQTGVIAFHIHHQEIRGLDIQWFVPACRANGEILDMLENPIAIPMDGSGTFSVQKTDPPIHVAISGTLTNDIDASGTIDIHYESPDCESTLYELPWTARRMSTCGDGTIEEPETCDDGNLVDDDDCSSLCVQLGPPPAWECPEDFFGDDYCDCGCGAPDPDCEADDPFECFECDCEFGCTGDPDIDGLCIEPGLPVVPPGWNCSPYYYEDEICDCGCGIPDPFCSDTLAVSCDDCLTCTSIFDDCLATVVPENNSQCL